MCFFQTGVLFCRERKILVHLGLFWQIFAVLSRIYAPFGVLFQAEIVRWCTKIDKVKFKALSCVFLLILRQKYGQCCYSQRDFPFSWDLVLFSFSKSEYKSIFDLQNGGAVQFVSIFKLYWNPEFFKQVIFKTFKTRDTAKLGGASKIKVLENKIMGAAVFRDMQYSVIQYFNISFNI